MEVMRKSLFKPKLKQVSFVIFANIWRNEFHNKVSAKRDLQFFVENQMKKDFGD